MDRGTGTTPLALRDRGRAGGLLRLRPAPLPQRLVHQQHQVPQALLQLFAAGAVGACSISRIPAAILVRARWVRR
jgi:hypothetical protein